MCKSGHPNGGGHNDKIAGVSILRPISMVVVSHFNLFEEYCKAQNATSKLNLYWKLKEAYSKVNIIELHKRNCL
jgi:hypothetical protein